MGSGMSFGLFGVWLEFLFFVLIFFSSGLFGGGG